MDRRQLLKGVTAASMAVPALASAASRPSAGSRMFDAHLHFFSNDVAHYPIDTRNAREPAEVMLARVMRDPGTPEKVFAHWSANNVGGGVGVQYSGAYKTDNRYLLDLADSYADRLVSEIIVDARDPDSVNKIAALRRTHPVAGLRLAGWATDPSWLDSPGAQPIWALADQARLPVGITYLPPLLSPPMLATVGSLARRYPGALVVLEHLGWADPQGETGVVADHEALRVYPNLRLKWTTINIDQLCAAGQSPAAFLRRAVDLFGAERLMWGSDFGNTLRPYEGMVADAIAATARLTERERDWVLRRTGMATFRPRQKGGFG